ncbi:MAG: hypothetical protein M3O34_06780, partial [Chloroflexota bacterium]|nr:hypothetical protein [Chloroflexota bacterium]
MTVDARPYTAERQAPPGAASARLGRTRGIDSIADRLIGLEPWLALPCALLLLAYPNPLVVPAGLIGVLPTLA